MIDYIKGVRRTALLLCFTGFIAGKLTFERIFTDLPALEMHYPLFIMALLTAILTYAKGYRIGKTQLQSYVVLAGYILFTTLYSLLPFPLIYTTDIAFNIGFIGLFAYLYNNEDRVVFTQFIIGLSVSLIIFGIITTPQGEPLRIAGSINLYMRITALSTFLILFETKGLLRLGVCLISGFALVAFGQLSGLVVILVCVLLFPIILVTQGLDHRSITVNFGCFLLGIILGVSLLGDNINNKLSHRLKKEEVSTVLQNKNETKSTVFLGGTYDVRIVRDGQQTTVKMPDFDKDTRVCVDDRSDRVKLFSTALYMAAQANDRWGWGDQAYTMKLTRSGILEEHTYPHNILLEILVTRGPYFLSVFMILLYFSILQGFIAAFRVPLVTPFVAYMIFSLLIGQWSGSFSDFSWFFMIMIPSLAANYEHSSKANTTSKKILAGNTDTLL